MTDESEKLRQLEQIDRAEAAARWLDDPIGREILDAMRAEMLTLIEYSPAGNRALRELLYLQLHLLRQFKDHAVAIIDKGRLAKDTLRQLEELAASAKLDELE